VKFAGGRKRIIKGIRGSRRERGPNLLLKIPKTKGLKGKKNERRPHPARKRKDSGGFPFGGDFPHQRKEKGDGKRTVGQKKKAPFLTQGRA